MNGRGKRLGRVGFPTDTKRINKPFFASHFARLDKFMKHRSKKPRDSSEGRGTERKRELIYGVQQYAVFEQCQVGSDMERGVECSAVDTQAFEEHSTGCGQVVSTFCFLSSCWIRLEAGACRFLLSSSSSASSAWPAGRRWFVCVSAVSRVELSKPV